MDIPYGVTITIVALYGAGIISSGNMVKDIVIESNINKKQIELLNKAIKLEKERSEKIEALIKETMDLLLAQKEFYERE